MNLDGTFSIRLSAPNTGSMDIATYYMTSFLCETSRALLERAIEGGFNFADCVIAPDGCTMINRCVENMELLKTMGQGNDRFFHQYMEIPLKADENGVELLKLQCRNHILTPLNRAYGIDTSDAAIRRAVAGHNEICSLIRAIGDFRKEERPHITGYEFHVLTLATYLAPKYLIVDKLRETLEEIRTREPEPKPYRARLMVVGSEVDDSGFIRLIEETGAYVCADRFCFGSLPGRDVIEMNDDEDALTQLCRQYVHRGQCPRMMNMEKVYGRKQYVNDVAREYGYPINLEFGGHGVGRVMHGDPHVPNDGKAHHGYKLRPGLVIAIEPWFLKTTDEIFQDPKDGWTLRSQDGSRGAHSEHTIAITDNGPLILTKRD